MEPEKFGLLNGPIGLPVLLSISTNCLPFWEIYKNISEEVFWLIRLDAPIIKN
jgi:hypothetical protein